MKKIVFLLVIVSSVSRLQAGDTLQLSDCWESAKNNYPSRHQLDYYSKITRLKVDNLNAAYYPELSLLGQAQYQSDVTKVELNIQSPLFKIPQVPVPPKDQYKVGISLNQIIWDGGVISAQKDIENIQGAVSLQNVEVELYSLKQRVNEAYFGILTLQQRMKSLEVSKSDLSEKLKTIRVRVGSGNVLQSNADILEAELLKLNQSTEELKSAKTTLLQTLGELLDRKLGNDITLDVPTVGKDVLNTDLSNRPEYKSFSLLKSQVEETQNLVDSKYMPKFSLYAQGMYAKPGLNMFDPDWAPYYIAGVQAKWNIWNWGSNSRENEILSVQKDIIASQEETFTKNLNIVVAKYQNDIERIQKLMEADNQIIILRKRITQVAETQMDNGTITATEYLTEFNAHYLAILNFELHKLELLQAKVNYLTQAGGEGK